jgi:hypothetical protein
VPQAGRANAIGNNNNNINININIVIVLERQKKKKKNNFFFSRMSKHICFFGSPK